MAGSAETLTTSQFSMIAGMHDGYSYSIPWTATVISYNGDTTTIDNSGSNRKTPGEIVGTATVVGTCCVKLTISYPIYNIIASGCTLVGGYIKGNSSQSFCIVVTSPTSSIQIISDGVC